MILLLPLFFGIAILGYRLYDIDVLINRTLVYSTLTALLVLIFVLQSLTHALTGQAGDNPLLIVTSTLVIAALFQPLRRRIQSLIDQTPSCYDEGIAPSWCNMLNPSNNPRNSAILPEVMR